jgi:hypothetical protein
MFNIKPVAGMEVSFKASHVELAGGQEIFDPSGRISNVFDDYIIVLFEDVVSDKGGHLYNDVVHIPTDHIPDVLEGFQWLDD